MLVISEQDIIKAVSFTELVDAIEKAFLIYEKGEYHMPERMHIDLSGNTLLLMPCFTKRKFATKLVSLFPENSKQNKPVLYGTVILNEGETGEPLALINGAKLTAMRTAAVGGTAIRWLSSRDTKSLGIIGAGIQGIHQALFALNERKIDYINVFDPNTETEKVFKHSIYDYYNSVSIKYCKSSEEVLEQSDAIIMATTATRPVLPDNPDKLKGKCFIAIGSYKPEMKEIPESLFKMVDQYFIDTDHAMIESGDLIDPLTNNWINKSNILPIGKLISGKVNLSSNDTRIFKSVGMALFDLVAADLIYTRAIEKKLGSYVKL